MKQARIAAPTTLLATLLLVLPSAASAISLATLAGGHSLTSADGAVTFSGFSVSMLDPIGEEGNALDLTLIDVQLVDLGDEKGLAFHGLGVDTYSLGQLSLHYDVEAHGDTVILGTSIGTRVEFSGSYAGLEVYEKVSGDASAALAAVVLGGILPTPVDAAVFAASAKKLSVDTEIWIEGGSKPTSVTYLEQRFRVDTPSVSASPTPEPGAALLFASGLVIAGARVRRVRRL